MWRPVTNTRPSGSCFPYGRSSANGHMAGLDQVWPLSSEKDTKLGVPAWWFSRRMQASSRPSSMMTMPPSQ